MRLAVQVLSGLQLNNPVGKGFFSKEELSTSKTLEAPRFYAEAIHFETLTTFAQSPG